MKDNELLLRKIKDGDDSALSEIIENNMGLVRSIAIRFCGRGVEYEDLVQTGLIGLLRAAREFDFSYGCVFSTYAVPLIIGEIKRFLRDDGIIKVSRSIKSTGLTVMRAREEYMRLNGREPTINELSEISSLSVEDISLSLEACSPVASLCDRGDGDCAIEDFIRDEASDFDRIAERLSLADAIESLSEMQKKIIFFRYKNDYSQQKTGEMLGISQVKVSREEKKIIERLRVLLKTP